MDIFNLMYDDFKFDKNKPLRLFEAFSGIGTQYMSLYNNVWNFKKIIVKYHILSLTILRIMLKL